MALILEFVNNGSGPDEAANYDVRVRVNQRVIALAAIHGHNRADHWTALVQRLLDFDWPHRKQAVATGGRGRKRPKQSVARRAGKQRQAMR